MHGVNENLPLVPASPTISSIGSDFSLENIPTSSMHARAPSSSSTSTLREHPTLYIRDDMVRVQVEDVLFRIPLFYLTDQSPYFKRLFEVNPAAAERLVLSDEDVNADAFANFIQVLRTPLGTPPPTIQSLAQWTDILHLSSKWEVSTLRTAAIEAILPLASAVDKIVLSRAYDIPEWLQGAFTDVLCREEDLTIEEARRLSLEDVIAIARGRREARTDKVKPRTKINQIAGCLLHPDQQAPEEEEGRPQADNHVPITAPDNAEERQRITRWLGQYQDKSTSAKSAEACLLQVIKSVPSKGPLLVEILLSKGLELFSIAYSTDERLWPKSGLRPDLPKIPTIESQVFEPLWQLWKASGRSFIYAPENCTCLAVIGQWQTILALPLDLDPFRIWAHPDFKAMLVNTVYVHYLMNRYSELADSSIYQTLWTRLTETLKPHTVEHATAAARTVQRFLNLTGTFISTNKASIQMDGFYELAERTRDQARDAGWHELSQSLKEIVEQRVWPKD